MANHHQRIATMMCQTDSMSVQNGLAALRIDSPEGQQYLNDMYLSQEYADVNRRTMLERMVTNMFDRPPRFKDLENFACVHNFISQKDSIIRKGAISAYPNEKVLVPLNMRDGIILGEGLGSKEWNFSAPHGAGRIMSRSQAKKQVSMSDFKTSMKDVWTTSVSKATLDEAPQVYKEKEIIINAIGDTVKIIGILKPVYNFKAGGE